MNSLLVFIGGLAVGAAIVIVLAVWSAKIGEKNKSIWDRNEGSGGEKNNRYKIGRMEIRDRLKGREREKGEKSKIEMIEKRKERRVKQCL